MLDKIRALRKQIHSYPEIGFKECKTHSSIKQFLVGQLGIDPAQIRTLATTGIITDLFGQAPPSGRRKLVALRADIDALSMKEETGLPYSSQTNAAHMCGHDGHTCTLLLAASKLISLAPHWPSDRGVRLLFQPSEQGPQSGALRMIEEGCLEGVDRIYGYHNWPTALAGEMWVKEGAVMSEVTVIHILIQGTEGHGSQPEKVIDAIRGAREFLDCVDSAVAECKSQGRLFTLSFPVFCAGQRYNVFSKEARLEGTLRSFEAGLHDHFKAVITQSLQRLKSKGFGYELKYKFCFPINSNSKEEAALVAEEGKKLFKVSKGLLPFKASQDFSFYTQKIPGAFFFVSSKRKEDDPMLHSSTFDFNEDILEPTSDLFVKIIQKQLSS